MWNLWSILILLWVACWCAIAPRHVAQKRGDELVDSCSNLLIPFAASTALLCCCFGGRHSISAVLALWLHHSAIWALFIFLVVAEALQWEAFWRQRCKNTTEEIAATYRRLWIWTKIVPAPVALTLLITGLRLLWQSADQNSISQLWLFALVSIFAVLFFDGICGFTPLVTNTYRRWQNAAVRGFAPEEVRHHFSRRSDRLQLAAHAVSWPFVFMIGVFRPSSSHGLSSLFRAGEGQLGHILPDGFPQVVLALAWWLAIGIVIWQARSAMGSMKLETLNGAASKSIEIPASEASGEEEGVSG
jgi:hypothetical protein